MNSIDLILLFFLSLFALRGFFKGLFREIFSLLGLFFGLMLAVRYNELVSVLWQDLWRTSPIIARAITFIVLFFVVYIAFNLAGRLIHLSTRYLFLTGVNRVGGILMGVGKGAALLGLILFFVLSSPLIPRQMKRTVDDSSLAPSLYRFGEGIFKVGKDTLFTGKAARGMGPRGLGFF